MIRLLRIAIISYCLANLAFCALLLWPSSPESYVEPVGNLAMRHRGVPATYMSPRHSRELVNQILEIK